MSTQEEFYRWWATLTQEQRINCWYDLDAMTHGEVVASLRAKVTEQSEELDRLRAVVRAADQMREELSIPGVDDGVVRYDAARGKVKLPPLQPHPKPSEQGNKDK